MTPTQWFEKMREVWLSQKPNDILPLLKEDLEYHENPLDPPLRTASSVCEAWQEIKNQEIEYVNITMLHEHNNVGMALWQFKEINQPVHIGGYYLELDEQGKCSLFRQWWNSK